MRLLSISLEGPGRKLSFLAANLEEELRPSLVTPYARSSLERFWVGVEPEGLPALEVDEPMEGLSGGMTLRVGPLAFRVLSVGASSLEASAVCCLPGIRLRAGDPFRAVRGYRAAVLTCSDRCSRGETVDESGPLLVGLLPLIACGEVRYRLVPDEVGEIREAVLGWAEEGLDLVLVSGGTGFAPRDHTPEALRPLFHRDGSSLAELFRLRSFLEGGFAMAHLTRGVAGVVGRTLVVSLPGSRRGALEAFGWIYLQLEHALDMLSAAERDCGRRG